MRSPVGGDADARRCRHTAVPTHRGTDTPRYRHTAMLTYRNTDTSSCRCRLRIIRQITHQNWFQIKCQIIYLIMYLISYLIMSLIMHPHPIKFGR